MILIAALLLSPTVHHRVEVEGRSYRIEVKDETVRVFQKSVISNVSLKRRRQMREAVRQATGCTITDDYWNQTILEGALDCSRD
jgi:hypothetical protein